MRLENETKVHRSWSISWCHADDTMLSLSLCKLQQGRPVLGLIRLQIRRNLCVTVAMADQNKHIKLPNGAQMPICGLGTWKVGKIRQ